MRLVVLDPLATPSGRERVTRRPAWRIRQDEREGWAFVEKRDGRILVTGYPVHAVDRIEPGSKPVENAVVGAGVGALIGASLGGPPGAWIGGLVGAMLLAGSKGPTRR